MEKARIRARRDWHKHRTKRLANKKRFYETHPDKKERRNAIERERGKVKKKEIRARVRERIKRDPQFRLRLAIRARITRALKFFGAPKSARTADLIGCDMPFLRKHIESQFKPGMTWNNHGEWHLDHKRPCASFNLLDLAQQQECFHWSNLQPLWKLDNMRKGAKTDACASSRHDSQLPVSLRRRFSSPPGSTFPEPARVLRAPSLAIG